MKIDILTIFPEMFEGPFGDSIIKRAKEKGLVEIVIHNLRDWSSDKRRTVDSSPYGGGAGMVMRVEVIDRAVEALKKEGTRVILLDTKGSIFKQQKAKELSLGAHLILIAGHYEGIDHRVHEHIADEVISIGEFVLTGGELPAMVVVDSIVRLIPGVLGNEASLSEESYEEEGKIEYPQYTRPEEYKGWKVPEILLSGDHKKIGEWRKGS
jgi:tRNA (guanine37-N1)-methyltransferase